jgi:hypothetical protein
MAGGLIRGAGSAWRVVTTNCYKMEAWTSPTGAYGYLTNSRSRILFEKLTFTQLVKKFSPFMEPEIF